VQKSLLAAIVSLCRNRNKLPQKQIPGNAHTSSSEQIRGINA
jgi:hypothetical protein